MNKLLTKIAASVLGLSMAIGVGVAAGSQGATKASATGPLNIPYDITWDSNGTTSTGSEMNGSVSPFSIKLSKGFKNTAHTHDYANGVITISGDSSVSSIDSVVITANGSYSGLQSSGTFTISGGGTGASASGTTTTATLTAGTNPTATWTISHNKQIRFTNIAVTYTESSGGTVTTPSASLDEDEVTLKTNNSSGIEAHVTIENCEDALIEWTENSNYIELENADEATVTIKPTSNAVEDDVEVELTVYGTDLDYSATLTVHLEEPGVGEIPENPFTVAQARAYIDTLGGSTSETRYAYGKISQIDKYNSTYNSIQYWISDDGTTTNHMEVYGGLAPEGDAAFTSKDDLVLGQTVYVTGNLKKYNTTYEFDANNRIYRYGKHTVTYTLNGGSIEGSTSIQIDSGSTVVLPTPTKSGYSFDGWQIDGSGTYYAAGSTSDRIIADRTYVAGWTETNTLTSISLNTSSCTTVFSKNSSFSYEGLVVTAHYEEGNQYDRTVLPTSVSSPDMTSVGDKEITVSYTEGGITKTATYNIHVNGIISGITTNMPSSLSLDLGESSSQYTATIEKDNDVTASVVWISSDTDKATVSNGTITASSVNAGKVTITVFADADADGVLDEGEFRETCELTVVDPADTPEGTYELVTSSSALEDGDRIVFTDVEKTYIMGSQGNNLRNALAIGDHISNGVITISNNDTAKTAKLAEKNGHFELLFDDGYLYANSNSNNNVSTRATNNDANGEWSFTIANDGEATCIAQGTNARKDLRYNYNNGSTPRFSCYATTTTMTKLNVFKKVIEDPTRVTGVTLNESEITIDITSATKTFALVATVEPSETALNKNVSWSSSDEEVATVSDSGLVTAIATGTTTITVTTEDGGKTATCLVKVIDSTVPEEPEGTYDSFIAADAGIDSGEDITEGVTEHEYFTLAFSKNTGSNAPKYYSTGTAVRCYAGNTITITSASSKAVIRRINFTFASGENNNSISADVGSFDTDHWEMTNGAMQSSVTLTIEGANGHRRIQRIDVVYYSAKDFAYDFLMGSTCDATGQNAPVIDWEALEGKYNLLLASEKTLLHDATYTRNGSVVTPTGGTDETIALGVARYDYLIGKYNPTLSTAEGMFNDYIGRAPSPITNESSLTEYFNNNSAVVIITLVSLISISAFGAFLFLRKRKEQ